MRESNMRLKSRYETTLINPTWEQIVENDPIMAFSHYLSGRIAVLVRNGDMILECLDRGFSEAPEFVDGGLVERAESLMWLWTLGAYEVVRTMCQAKTCFSQATFDELFELKKSLARARMPAAKMEKPGQKIPVTSNRSPAGWDLENRDLLVNDPEDSSSIHARWLINEFDRVLASIGSKDVLAPHEAAYER
jgi:hypothetical protein